MMQVEGSPSEHQQSLQSEVVVQSQVVAPPKVKVDRQKVDLGCPSLSLSLRVLQVQRP